MKKLFITASFLVTVFLGQAQNCEFSQVTASPDNQSNYKETKETVVYNYKKRLSISFANNNGKKYMVATMSLPGNTGLMLSARDKAVVLLENGETLELPLLTENGQPVTFGQSQFTGTTKVYRFFYPLASTDILAGKSLGGFRIYHGPAYTEFYKAQTNTELGLTTKGKIFESLENIFSADKLNCIN